MKNLTDFRKTVETGVDPRLGRFSLFGLTPSFIAAGGFAARVQHLCKEK